MPPLPRTSRSSYRSCSFVRLDVMSPPDRPMTLPDAGKRRLCRAIVRSAPPPGISDYIRPLPVDSVPYLRRCTFTYSFMDVTLFDGHQIAGLAWAARSDHESVGGRRRRSEEHTSE